MTDIESDHDGITLAALRAYLVDKTAHELAGTLRDLSKDYRLDYLPAKFRCVMEAAANKLEKLDDRPAITDEEQKALKRAADDYTDSSGTVWLSVIFRGLLERFGNKQ